MKNVNDLLCGLEEIVAFMEAQKDINDKINENVQLVSKGNGNNSSRILTLIRSEDETKKRLKKIELDFEEERNRNKTRDEEFKQTKEELKQTKEVVVVLTDKLNTLEHDDERTLKEIIKEGRRRVVSICGGKTTPRYILFSRGYFQEMYGFIGEALANGKRIGKIKVEDGATAMTLIKRWKPKSDKKRTQDLQKMDSKGLLSSEKSKALEVYLDEINS